MTNDERKLLQEIQTHRGWNTLEKFLNQYIDSLDLKGSIRMNSEFETIWNRAYNEGGEHHLRNFILQLDSEARKYD